MYTINRAVAIVKPKQPFADWANSHRAEDEPLFDLELMRDDCNAFLINDIVFSEDGDIAMKFFHPLIFNECLAGYHAEESMWPETRDYATFLEWFDVEIHSMVIDLGSTPIVAEEL